MGRGVAIATLSTTSLLWALLTAHNTAAQVYVMTLACAAVVGYYLRNLDLMWLGVVCVLTAFLIVYPFLPFTINRNALGAAVALTAAGAITAGIYWFFPLALVSLLILGSRGAFLALVITIALSLRNRWATLTLFIIAAAIVAIFSTGRVDTIAHRFGIWQDTLSSMSIWGHGFGSFADAYAAFPRKTNAIGFQFAPHAYNDYLELLFELGLFAIPLWIALILCLDTEGPHLVPITFLILAVSYFPLYIPGVAHIALVTFGHALRRPSPWQDGALQHRTI